MVVSMSQKKPKKPMFVDEDGIEFYRGWTWGVYSKDSKGVVRFWTGDCDHVVYASSQKLSGAKSA